MNLMVFHGEGDNTMFHCLYVRFPSVYFMIRWTHVSSLIKWIWRPFVRTVSAVIRFLPNCGMTFFTFQHWSLFHLAAALTNWLLLSIRIGEIWLFRIKIVARIKLPRTAEQRVYQNIMIQNSENDKCPDISYRGIVSCATNKAEKFSGRMGALMKRRQFITHLGFKTHRIFARTCFVF